MNAGPGAGHNAAAAPKTLIDEIRAQVGAEAYRWGELAKAIIDIPTTRLTRVETALSKVLQKLPDALRASITREVLDKEYLRILAARIAMTGKVSDWVDPWQVRVGGALQSAPEQKGYILATFSLVDDYALTLDQDVLDDLLRAIADWSGTTVPKMLGSAKARLITAQLNPEAGLERGLDRPEEIVAAIVSLMDGRQGLKPPVRAAALQQHLVAYFDAEIRKGRARRTLGGAAGNESYILGHSGWPTLVASLYNHGLSGGSAGEIAPCVKRLMFGAGGPAQPYGEPSDGDASQPARRSHVLQITKVKQADGSDGPVIRMPGGVHRPLRAADRIILTLRNYRTVTPATWQKLCVVWRPTPGVAPRTIELDRSAFGREIGAHDWPALPAFQHPATVDREGVLTIELAGPDELVALRPDLQAVLLGGVQKLGEKVYSEPLTNLLRDALEAQLRSLTKSVGPGDPGVPVFFELSDAMAPEKLLTLWRLCQKAGVRYFSSNREELQTITSEAGSRFFVAPRTGLRESAYFTCWRAIEFLRKLGAAVGAQPPFYYIHDSELDLLICPPGLGEQELAHTLKHGQQAMIAAKVLVPMALLRRASGGSTAPPPSDSTTVPSPQSLVALLNFAGEYAAAQFAAHGGGSDEQFKALTRQLRDEGIYLDPDGFSVAVAPAVHVDFDTAVSTAGAGDMNCAIFAAWLSGGPPPGTA